MLHAPSLGSPLESVVQAKLYLPGRRAHAVDQAETAVIYVVVGVPIAGDVEDVEKISAETEDMILFPAVKVFEQRHIDLAIAGSTLAAVGRTSEFKLTFVAVGTGSVIDSSLKTGGC